MKTKRYLVALVLLTFIFASCDSLWQVGESTDVSMSINLRDIAGGSLFLGDDDDGFDVEFNSIYDELNVVVSLHNVANNSVVESQVEKVSPTETSSDDILVTFKSVPVNLEVYAKVEVYGLPFSVGDPQLIFSAQSNDTAIKIGKNNIVARPNLLFYAGDKLTYVLGGGNEIESGNNEEILDAALEALGGRNNLAPNATVVMNDGLIQIDSAVTRDYGGLRLLRGNSTLNLLILGSSADTVNISNIVLDATGFENGSQFSLLKIESASTVTLTNVTLKNNTGAGAGAGVSNYGTLTMNNCTVSGNSTSDEGGGIYNEASRSLYINNCSITGNTAEFGGGVHAYDAATFEISNSTITGNTASGNGRDVFGIFTDNGGNTIGNTNP